MFSTSLYVLADAHICIFLTWLYFPLPFSSFFNILGSSLLLFFHSSTFRFRLLSLTYKAAVTGTALGKRKNNSFFFELTRMRYSNEFGCTIIHTLLLAVLHAMQHLVVQR